MSISREGLLKHRDLLNAWLDGDEIEQFYSVDMGYEHPQWSRNPLPNFRANEQYRVKKTADYIDWSHVYSKWNFIARDSDGKVILYSHRPHLLSDEWGLNIDGLFKSDVERTFTSYKQGSCDWKDSLVSRAQCEASDVAKAV